LATARASVSFLQPQASDQDRSQHWHKAQDRLREMAGGLERIRALVLKLRTFSRLDEGERKVVNVRECVESVLMILGHRLRHRIEVELRFADPEELDCFPSLLNQALMNLIANAIDAIDEVAHAGKLVIVGGAEGSVYVLRITDNGPGVAEEVRDRVFDPFFTTKDVGKGTGLGLSITYSIIRKHGGTLELLPAPGGGTIAEIKLPLAGPESSSKALTRVSS
jgi:two-component system NtrC family sensor kinase